MVKRMRMEWYEGSEDCWMQDDPDGRYVEFEEAQAEIDALRSEVFKRNNRIADLIRANTSGFPGTLWDWYAGMALQSMLSRVPWDFRLPLGNIIDDAGKIADEMMEEREKRK